MLFYFQNVNVSFINNTARLSGAAIYASDLRRCSWLGNNYTNDTSLIFRPPENLSNSTPFYFEYVGILYSGKVWRIDSFQAFGTRKFGELIADLPNLPIFSLPNFPAIQYSI